MAGGERDSRGRGEVAFVKGLADGRGSTLGGKGKREISKVLG